MDTEKEEVKVGVSEEVKATTEGSSSDSARSEHGEAAQGEKAQDGIILIPQPSSDPRDPLVRTHLTLELTCSAAVHIPRCKSANLLSTELGLQQKNRPSRRPLYSYVRRLCCSFLRPAQPNTTIHPLWQDHYRNHILCK